MLKHIRILKTSVHLSLANLIKENALRNLILRGIFL